MSRQHPKKIASDAIATYVIGLIVLAIVVGPLLDGVAAAINAFGNFAESAARLVTG